MQTASFLSSHGKESRGRKPVLLSLKTHPIHKGNTLLTSSNSSHLLKALPPDTITLVSVNLRDTNIQSTETSKPVCTVCLGETEAHCSSREGLVPAADGLTAWTAQSCCVFVGWGVGLAAPLRMSISQLSDSRENATFTIQPAPQQPVGLEHSRWDCYDFP